MGWTNSHLYSFKENHHSRFFYVVSPYTEEFGMHGTTIHTGQILWDMLNQYVPEGRNRLKMIYQYDYGDNWDHEIDVIEMDRSNKTAAELIDGAGACPPEDCGGVMGFEDIKKSLRTGKPSEIHGESWVPWLEGTGYKNYDPDVYDLGKGKRRVKRWKDFIKWEKG
jgi:hypothetical protein